MLGSTRSANKGNRKIAISRSKNNMENSGAGKYIRPIQQLISRKIRH